jgi:hypothetical protein
MSDNDDVGRSLPMKKLVDEALRTKKLKSGQKGCVCVCAREMPLLFG